MQTAQTNSGHVAVPVESTDTSLHTASGLYFDMEDAMRKEHEEGAMVNQIRGIVENAGKRETEEGGEVQIYEAELAYIDSILETKPIQGQQMNQQTNSGAADLVSGEIKHTALPWLAKPAADGHGDFGIIDGKVVIAEVFCDLLNPDERNVKQARANAEFIVRACNARDDLVKALQDLLDDHQHMEPHHEDLCQTCLSAAAALRKAGVK